MVARAINGTFPFFFFQAEDGIRDATVTGVQTCALPILTGADNVVTTIRPAPAPRVPATVLEPGLRADRSPSNPLLTRPEVDRRSMSALASAGSRTATSPETVVTRSAPSARRSTSAVTLPLTVFASRSCTEPPASVRSPHTELRRAAARHGDRDLRGVPLRAEPAEQAVPGQVLIGDRQDAGFVADKQRLAGKRGHVDGGSAIGGEDRHGPGDHPYPQGSHAVELESLGRVDDPARHRGPSLPWPGAAARGRAPSGDC